MPTIEESLYSKLMSDSALTSLIGDRLYPDEIPEFEPETPFVYYTVTSSEPSEVLRGGATSIKNRVEFEALADTKAGVKAIAAALRTSLHGFAGGQVRRALWAGNLAGVTENGYHTSILFDVFETDGTLVPVQNGLPRVEVREDGLYFGGVKIGATGAAGTDGIDGQDGEDGATGQTGPAGPGFTSVIVSDPYFTIGAADNHKIISINRDELTVVRLSNDVSPGNIFYLEQHGTGSVVFITTDGGSLFHRLGHKGLDGQYAVAMLYVRKRFEVDPAEWVLSGDTAAVTPPAAPTIVSAVGDGTDTATNAFLITMSEAVTGTTGFTVFQDGVELPSSIMEISGVTIRMDVNNGIVFGGVLTLNYSRAAGDVINSVEIELDDIADFAVTNATQDPAPYVVSAATDAAGSPMTITMSGTVTGTTGFALFKNGIEIVSAIGDGSGGVVDSTTIQLYYDDSILFGDVITLNYQDDTGDIVNGLGIELRDLADFPVTNNTPE